MADAVSMSMGGRVANIYRQNVKKRRYTTVVNEIETKKLDFIKKQLESDRTIEYNKLQRDNNRVTNANDEMKAFQIALLRRIGVVKEQSKLAAGTRPLMNLGKYGGATVEYIKSESEKYKRIRDPKRRRLIKAKISLEQGKKDGRIKEFDPRALGNMAVDILRLYKADVLEPVRTRRLTVDIGNLDDVTEADELETMSSLSSHSMQLMDSDSKQLDVNRATYPQTQPRRLVLPPLQVKRSLNPNSNYYRKISAEFHKREALLRNKQHPASPIHKRISILEDITEEGNGTRRHQSYKNSTSSDHNMNIRNYTSKFPVTSIANYDPKHYASKPLNAPQRSKGRNPAGKGFFEWDYTKSVGPIKVGKHLNDSQKFWKPQESFPSANSRSVALPKIQ